MGGKMQTLTLLNFIYIKKNIPLIKTKLKILLVCYIWSTSGMTNCSDHTLSTYLAPISNHQNHYNSQEQQPVPYITYQTGIMITIAL